jgi:hypothetical protein
MSEEARANVCDYYGCRTKIAPGQESITGMRFCETHLAELNKIIEAFDAKGILSFWVRSSGGPQKMVHTPAGVYQSHELARSGFDPNPLEVTGKSPESDRKEP